MKIKCLVKIPCLRPEFTLGFPQVGRIDLGAESMENPPRHLAFVLRSVKPAPETSGRLETKKRAAGACGCKGRTPVPESPRRCASRCASESKQAAAGARGCRGFRTNL